ncbi:MAG: DNA-3-methyladenine glycosylase [Verrucomicrobia bacterium]|nr:DNA-3-methyladenine glycosylase [Verrucomicrobiota bacterium]MDA1087782.1 DNA-3-methyladenine glycosylase [Verrucomicrobiota bacterium]
MKDFQPRLTAGPGCLSTALGIRTRHSGVSLRGDQIWIEASGSSPSPRQILASPRIGVAYAGADAVRAWRFRLRSSDWTSPAA